jgi:ubiquinol-cytochrome c reductase cytochrome c1 subunit
MTTTMNPKDAQKWFGAAPPDLSVIARARSSGDGSGADWLYTYLRTFYKDNTRPSGWNNMVFNNVGMPHALWELQGIQEIKPKQAHAASASAASAHGSAAAAHEDHALPELIITKAGKMSKTEYDTAVADLVGYMSWMAEPVQAQRRQLGGWVLMFMSILALLAWRLNASFWKEVK